MDVEASRAIRQAEVGAAKTMIERTEERFDIKPERLAADTAYGSGANLNWLVKDKKIAPHIPVIDKSKHDDGTFSREDFTFVTKSVTYTSARRARSSPRRARWSMTGKHFYIGRAGATVVPACSRRNAVQRPLSAGFHVASTRRLVTLPGRWPRPRRSSSHAATGSLSRCYLHISSASCGSAVCVCAGHAVLNSSSRWPRSSRTSAGWPSSSPVRHRWPPHVWCERQSRCSRVDGVSAVASTERLVGQGSR